MTLKSLARSEGDKGLVLQKRSRRTQAPSCCYSRSREDIKKGGKGPFLVKKYPISKNRGRLRRNSQGRGSKGKPGESSTFRRQAEGAKN